MNEENKDDELFKFIFLVLVVLLLASLSAIYLW